MAETALVTGGTGAVGPLLVNALLDEGFEVRVLTRRAPLPSVFKRAVVHIAGDVTDRDTVRRAVDGASLVFNLAALLHINNPPPAMRKAYEAVNVGGTENLVEEAKACGVTRLVQFSTIVVYGPTGGVVVNEESAVRPDTIYGITKRRAEEIALAARNARGDKLGTVLRFAAIYGARVKGNYQRLLHAIVARRFVSIGPGTNRRTLIYEKDAAVAAIVAGRAPSAAGEIYNVTDGTFHTVQEIVDTIAGAARVKAPRVAISAGAAAVATASLNVLSRLGLSALERAALMLSRYREDVAVDASKIQQELGFVPRYSLRDGWAEAIAELEQRGRLHRRGFYTQGRESQ